MALAELIIRAIDWFYIRPVAAVLPRQVFRYVVCGGVTYILFDPVCYFLFYNFIVAHRYVDLGFVVVSPHIAAMILVFPFTFFVGFWLNRYVAFRRSPIGAGTQLLRYLLSVAGSVLLTYAGLKFFVEVWRVAHAGEDGHDAADDGLQFPRSQIFHLPPRGKTGIDKNLNSIHSRTTFRVVGSGLSGRFLQNARL